MIFEYFKKEAEYISKEEISREAQEKLLKRAKARKLGADFLSVSSWF